MRRRSLGLVVLSLVAVACAHPPVPVQLPASAASIAVFPPLNRTGDDLLVAGTSALEKYALRTDRITVPDLLASEARFQLQRRGFDVVPSAAVDAALSGKAPATPQDAATLAARNHLDGSVLFIDIRRWEPDQGFEPKSIIASVQLTLIDTATGRVLWTIDHPSRPLSTAGAVNLGAAYTIAAQALMEQLLAPLHLPTSIIGPGRSNGIG